MKVLVEAQAQESSVTASGRRQQVLNTMAYLFHGGRDGAVTFLPNPLLPMNEPGSEGGAFLRVVIADDSVVVRERVAALLSETPGVRVVAVSGDVKGTLHALRTHQPDLLILDLSMPGGSGLEVLRQLRSENSSVAAVMLTNYAYPEFERQARELGAVAFFDKTREFLRVADLVREMAAAHTSAVRR